MLGHEVDDVGRRHLCRHDEIALVLPILRIDEHDHAPVAHLLDDHLGRRQELMAGLGAGLGGGCREAVGHGRNSIRRAT